MKNVIKKIIAIAIVAATLTTLAVSASANYSVFVDGEIVNMLENDYYKKNYEKLFQYYYGANEE